jgi:hypothetical protein
MSLRLLRALFVAMLGAWALTWQVLPTLAQSQPLACGIDMRVLVISADGREADFPAIRAALDYIGTPYDVYIATENPGGLTPERLASGCRARYQGVILTTDNLGYFPQGGGGFTSAFTPAEFQVLASYESQFGVRQVTWYTFPTPEYGLNIPSGGTAETISARVTTEGAKVFPHLRRGTGSAPIPIQFSWTYLTTLVTPGDPSTIPLLTDAAGHVLASIHVWPDGRQNLAMTFDSNANLLHAWLLSYGVVNWVTSGVFIGERRAYISPQVDDIYLDNTRWLVSTPCGTDVDNTGATIRMTGSDFTAFTNWQTNRRRQNLTSGLRVSMVFNGEGTTGVYDPDTLTPTVTTLQNNFFWVNHTFTHANLDAISYADATSEITLNNAIPTQFGLNRFSRQNLVQPDVSGLGNADFLRAARDAGVRYLISDTSRPGQDNPTPNTGRWSFSQPQIFVIPRRANNLFFNVATPADWAAEYNCIYRSFWGRDLTINEILDLESQTLMSYLLRGELDPWMFHQANLVAYDGTRSLLSDLLDRTFAKYNTYTTLPVVSVNMNTLGSRMANRTTLRAAGIDASIQPGVGIVLKAPVAMTVPITGVRVGDDDDSDSYGGEWISFVSLAANRPVTIPLTASAVPGEAPTANAGGGQTAVMGAAVTLRGTASDSNTPPRPLTFTWTQTAGPAVTLSNANTLAPGFIAPVLAPTEAPVALRFTLTVSNGLVSASDTTTVTVNPLPPTVTAAAPQTVDAGTLVTLSGTATDPNAPPRPLTYAWTQTSGSAVALSDAATAQATFTAPLLPATSGPVLLGFRFTASNPLSASATTTVTVRPLLAAGAVAVRNVFFSDGAGTRNASVTANAGDLLLAFVAAGGPSSALQTASVSGANLTWTLVQRTNANLGTAEIWSATTTTALNGVTVSSTPTIGGHRQSLTVVAFSNSSGVGASGSGTGPTGAPRVTVVTTSPGSLVFGVGNDWDNDVARTVPPGQALTHQHLTNVDDTFWVQHLIGAVAAAGTTVTLENPAPTTNRWNYSAVEILQ